MSDIVMDSVESNNLQLDQSAIDALNLMPKDGDRKQTAESTVYGLLHRGRTAMSGPKLRHWLRYPSLSLAEIERRQNYIQVFMDDQDVYSQLYDTHMKGMPDIERVIKRMRDWGNRDVSKKVDQEGIIKIILQGYSVVQKFPAIIGVLKNYTGTHRHLLEREVLTDSDNDILPQLQVYSELVETCIDLAAFHRHEFRMNPSNDDSLTKVDNKIRNCVKQLEELREDYASQMRLDSTKVKLLNSPTHGWCLRVTRKDETHLRNLRGITTLSTLKDGVYFTSIDLRACADSRKNYEAEYRIIQEIAVVSAMDTACTFLPYFERVNHIITEIDVFIGIAHAALHSGTIYVRPEVLPLGSGLIEFKQARHPCVEHAAMSGSTYIPNDVKMEKDKSRFQIMTGPNMGGKSTYIRMVGVLCVMAQIGSPLPCESARVSILEKILARVGAGDDAQEGVSTFMAEMMEASTIVKEATENSLVIIDELGRGTSTYDGFGLAWSISENLARDVKCFAFFATHFAELPALATQHPCVSNLHVTAHTDDHHITMLYEVKPGASDRSFGVHVAKVANFPAEVVNDAREKAIELERFSGGIDSILDKKDEAGEIESSPAESMGSTLASKRIRLNPDSQPGPIVPVAEYMKEFYEHPLTDFQNEVGEIDMAKFAAFVKQIKSKRANTTATPMEM